MENNYLCCPLCKGDLSWNKSGNYQCNLNHNFDVSKYNYLNLHLKKSNNLYDEALFISRKRIFEAGFYEEVAKALETILKQYEVTTIVDVGAGEGYYTSYLCKKYEIIAMDISKEAIKLGARKKESHTTWLVADLSNIPLRNNSMDAVLNVFTPSNYDEFKRVLKPEGLVIKVIPGAKHFKELRDCYQLKAHSNQEVKTLFSDMIELKEVVEVCTTYNCDQLSDDVVKMSPLSFNRNEKINLSHITINAVILIGLIK